MLQVKKVNILFLVGIMVSFVITIITKCDAKPMDIYDEIMDGDEQQLLLHMAELIESIGSVDLEYDSGRLSNINAEKNSATIGNELKDMKPGERCILPIRKGVCRALIPRWSYDPIARECKEFKFGGCDGNGNNFATRKQCMEVCRGI